MPQFPAKPHYGVPIDECGEPLVPIPLKDFAVFSPHPYVQRSAPYGAHSPYFLRQGVLERLVQARILLKKTQPNWQLCIFDAYRPVAVQKFMVEATFVEQVEALGLTQDALTPQEENRLWSQVYQFWALPTGDATTPPPHSTGAAVDLTLADSSGQPLDMGSPIDEISPRSHPNHFALEDTPKDTTPNPNHARFHNRRQTLNTAMEGAGFRRHQQEWWHFSYGDQMWAWLTNQEQPDKKAIARYGGV
ncbi:MAG: M15 family metallopeptidase [Elainellaceae cyanobacterium]